MLKIIIVDDEPLVRMGIKSCIPWEENGFSFAGEAADGEEALALLQKIPADIVFTDIKMPNMDGITLIQRLKDKMPDTKVIVLSCINEMETVKQALLLGADDYILKLSLKPADLVSLLKSLKKKIEEERNARRQQESYHNMISDHLHVIKGSLLNEYLAGQKDADQMVSAFNLMEPDSFPKSFHLILAVLDQVQNLHFLLKQQSQFLQAFAHAARQVPFQWAYLRNAEFLLWADSAQCCRDTLCQTILPRFNRKLAHSANVTCSFVLSERALSVEELPQAVTRQRLLLPHRFYLGNGCIILPEKTVDFSSAGCIWPLSQDARIKKVLESGNFEEFKQEIRQDLQRFRQEHALGPDKLKIAALALISGLLKQIGVTESVQGSPAESPKGCQSETIMQIETIQELEQCILTVVDNVALYQDSSSTRREIRQAKKYVYEHLDSAITIDSVARHVNISRSYFSSLFKREEGENFIDFVNRAKMEHAYELLCRHDYRVYEVAAMVGIPNETYFSKLFKKHLGITPRQIKTQGVRDDNLEEDI